MIRVREATIDDLDGLAPLFDAYRQFYDRPSDPYLARAFLSDRLARGESVVFLAERDGDAIGFVQLYPVFSSTSPHPGRSWILNDLFVAPAARGQGVGRRLLERAYQMALDTDACGIELLTGRSNIGAQALYQSVGYHRDDEFLRYERVLP